MFLFFKWPPITPHSHPYPPYAIYHTVFSLTLARSPMASRSYRRVSDFLNYSPGLASDILAERKSEKKKKKIFFKKIVSPSSHDTVAFQKLI